MTVFVIYLLISGVGFPVCLGKLIHDKKKNERKENISNESNC